jgi:DNA-binding transcriptional regulator YhcF (GntR family)
MQITDVYGQRFHLNPNDVVVAYKTAEGECVIDLSNGETMYVTENSYKRVVAWMMRQYE